MRNIKNEIFDLNLSYLLLSQRLLLNDKSTGMFRLGIGEDVASVVSGLSLQQIIKLSKINQLVCTFRFNDKESIMHITKTSRLELLQGIHASLLLSKGSLNVPSGEE